MRPEVCRPHSRLFVEGDRVSTRDDFGPRFVRMMAHLAVTVVVGGLAVGACLAALIPGTATIATAQHYTATSVKALRALSEPSRVYWSDGKTEMPCGDLG